MKRPSTIVFDKTKFGLLSRDRRERSAAKNERTRDTLENVALPNLCALGLGNIKPLPGLAGVQQ